MKDVTIQDTPGNSLGVPGKEDVSGINSCCVKTVDALSANNSMMVCPECKQIIKTFKDERAYRNYILFCRGRSRVIQMGYHDNQWVVVYHSYDA